MPKVKDYNVVKEAVVLWMSLGPVPKRFPAAWNKWVIAMSATVVAEQRQLNPGGDIDLTEETELGETSSRILDEIKTWLRGQAPFFKNV